MNGRIKSQKRTHRPIPQEKKQQQQNNPRKIKRSKKERREKLNQTPKIIDIYYFLLSFFWTIKWLQKNHKTKMIRSIFTLATLQTEKL